MTNDESKLTQNLYFKITAFLKKYGQEKGLQIVLKVDPSSDVLFGSGPLDITKDVVGRLNTEYASEKLSAPDSVTTKKK